MSGNFTAKDAPIVETDKQRETGGKVAEIDFFRVGNHAKKCHLSKDKVTKSSDKVFVLKKTFTQFDNV